MFEMWEIGAIFYLCIGTLWDLRRREIPMLYLLIGTCMAAGNLLWMRPQVWYEYLLGLITGILFCMLSKFTREQIGYGDSWMILNLGIWFGMWKLMVILFIGFGVCTLTTVIGIIGKRMNGKERIPFYPFLLIGLIGAMLC